jgi:hypothetical protein
VQSQEEAMLKAFSVAAVMLSGCISASSAEAATVHFFRGSGFWGHGVRASVYVDESLIAKMPGNTVAILRLAPGFHVFRGVNKMEAVRLNLAPGKDYYMKVVIVDGTSRQFLQETTAQEAKPIISKLKPLDRKYLVQYLRHGRADE